MSPWEAKQHIKGCTRIIGIDPGTHTGIAIWLPRFNKFEDIKTVGIVEAMDELRSTSRDLLLVIEDARTRSGSEAAKMGAGSIRRDCAIWQEFAAGYGFKVWWKMTPRGINRTSKLSKEEFRRATGWTKRTDQHGRDAAMLVYAMA